MSVPVNKRSEKIVEDIFGLLVDGNETNISCYEKYAKDYDEGLTGIQYDNPERFGKLALKYLQNNSLDMQALDICAGTGLMGEALVRSGFKGHVDAIDGNEAMLAEAKKKNIFRNFTKMIITPGSKLPYPDNTYDIALCGGAFSEGHLRPDCLWEFVRILKPGGVLVFNTTNHSNCEELDNQVADEGLDKADSIIQDMVKEGVCRVAESMTCECFSHFSSEYKYKNDNVDLIRCCVKL